MRLKLQVLTQRLKQGWSWVLLVVCGIAFASWQKVWDWRDFSQLTPGQDLLFSLFQGFAWIQDRLVEPLSWCSTDPDCCSISVKSRFTSASTLDATLVDSNAKSIYLISGFPPENGSWPLLEQTSPLLTSPHYQPAALGMHKRTSRTPDSKRSCSE